MLRQRIRLLAKSLDSQVLDNHLDSLDKITDSNSSNPPLMNTPEAYQTAKPTETKLKGIVFKVPKWALTAGKHLFDAMAAVDSDGRIQRLGPIMTEGEDANTRYVSSFGLMPKHIYDLAVEDEELAASDLGRHIVFLRHQYPTDEEFGRAINRITENQGFDDLFLASQMRLVLKIISRTDLPPKEQIKALAFGHHYGPKKLDEILRSGSDLDSEDSDAYIGRFMENFTQNTEPSRRAVHLRNTFYNQHPSDVVSMRVEEELDTEPEAMDPLEKGFKSKIKTGAALGAAALGGAAFVAPEKVLTPAIHAVSDAVSTGRKQWDAMHAPTKTPEIKAPKIEAKPAKAPKIETPKPTSTPKISTPAPTAKVPDFSTKMPKMDIPSSPARDLWGKLSDAAHDMVGAVSWPDTSEIKTPKVSGFTSGAPKATMDTPPSEDTSLDSILGAAKEKISGTFDEIKAKAPSVSASGPVAKIPHPPKGYQFPKIHEDTGWTTSKDVTFQDVIAARETSGGANRIHDLIVKPESGHYGTRAVSTYGIMPMTAKTLVGQYPELADSPVGKKIQALSDKYNPEQSYKGRVAFGKAVNAITNNPKNDDLLMHYQTKNLEKAAIKSGYKPGTQDYYAALGFAHFYGEGALMRTAKEGGTKAIYAKDAANPKERGGPYFPAYFNTMYGSQKHLSEAGRDFRLQNHATQTPAAATPAPVVTQGPPAPAKKPVK